MKFSEILVEAEISSKEVEEIFKRAIELMLDTESDKEEQETNTYKTPKDFADRSWAKESRAQSDITTAIMEVDSKSENLMKRFMDTWKQYHNAPDTEVITAVLLRNGVSEEILQQLEVETALGTSDDTASDEGNNNGEQSDKNKPDGKSIKGDKEDAVDGIKTSMTYMANWKDEGQDIGDNYNVTMKSTDQSQSLDGEEQEQAKDKVRQHASRAEDPYLTKIKDAWTKRVDKLRSTRINSDGEKVKTKSHFGTKQLSQFLLDSGLLKNAKGLEVPDVMKKIVAPITAEVMHDREKGSQGGSQAFGKGDAYKVLEILFKNNELQVEKQPKIDKE